MSPYFRMLLSPLVGVILTVAGCASPGTESTRPAIPLAGRVMIVPTVDLTRLGSPGQNVQCPISGRVVHAGAVEAGADRIMTDSLIAAMSRLPHVNLLMPSQAQGAIAQVMAMPGTNPSDASLWRHAGRLLGAEHFAVICLYRFQERVGRNYGVEEPASVGFGLHLVNVGDGGIVWSGWYDETQAPLNQNLLQLGTFLKRKGQWITVRDMASQAVAGMVDKMTTTSIDDDTPDDH